MADSFSAIFSTSVQKAPRKLSPFHHFLKLYYYSHVKDEYVRRFESAKKEYDDATADDRQSGAVKKPVGVQLRTETGMEFWLLESKKFRDKIAQEAEDAHVKEVEEWEELKQVPTTPLQFHQ